MSDGYFSYSVFSIFKIVKRQKHVIMDLHVLHYIMDDKTSLVFNRGRYEYVDVTDIMKYYWYDSINMKTILSFWYFRLNEIWFDILCFVQVAH